MLLNIKGGDCDDSERPTTCDVLAGEEFLLSVDAVAVPSSGYILMQTFVNFGEELTYKPAQLARQEVSWPDCQSSTAVRGQFRFIAVGQPPVETDEVVHHGCLSGLLPPIPVSHYVGNLVEISLTCSAEPTSNEIDLIPATHGDPINFPDEFTIAGTSGAKFTYLNGGQQVSIIPKLSGITINCVDVLPEAVGGVALDGDLAPLGALEAGEQRSRVWGSWLAGALVALLGVVLVSAIVSGRLRSRS